MSMYKMFKTDGGLESEGIFLDYGSFRVRIARAGGQNKRYMKALEAATRPYRRAIDTGMLSPERSMEIMRQVFAQTVVLGWEIKVGDQWQAGIEAEDGSIMPFNVDNVKATLEALPDLFADIQEQANRTALFRETVLESAEGN